MASPMESLRRLSQRPSLQLVVGLGAATVVLFLAAIIGAFAVNGKDDTKVKTAATGSNAQSGTNDLGLGNAAGGTGDTVAGETTLPGTSGTIATSGNGTSGGVTKGKTAGGTGGTGVSSSGGAKTPGDRTGVSATSIKWALHAPVTFDGTPVNLAADPLEGVDNYIQYINNNGGINGRKIEYQVFDDKYTVEGGKAAANAAVDDYKPFFVSGTLGVDQIYQVAAEARKRGVPYIAGGGSESIFKDISMFQVSGSYDTHLILLADFLGAQSKKSGSMYFGRKKVGVSALDSPYIAPAVDSFKKALAKNGLSLVQVVKVQHPTEQTSYASQIQSLKDAGTEIFVPAQDPITTSRELQECVSQACSWKYAVSDFAHESDTALKLMGGQWNGVTALAGGCYYTNPDPNPSHCGQLQTAHAQWVQIKGESDWQSHGQGGTAGYQLVHIWLRALKDIGQDPTREKFRAALLTYDTYNDLVSAPITYKGSSNLSHGYDKVVVYTAGADKWSQVGPGFTDQF